MPLSSSRVSPAVLPFSLGIILTALLSLSGCPASEPTIPDRELPPGTVMVLDGEAITSDEVDSYIENLRAIMPAYTKTHRRRQALTNLLFPMVYGRARYPVEREVAHSKAEAWRAFVLAGEEVSPPGETVVGNWDILGLDIWMVLRGLEEEEWSAVCEGPGHFIVAQLLGRDRAVHGGQEMFQAHVVEFPYAPNPDSLLTDCIDGTLEITDPAWHEIVPGHWEYAMRGESK
jgi:hypothetical protein